MDATPQPQPGEPQPSGAFAVGYRAHQGDMMVYGGGALTVVGVLTAVVTVAPLGLLAALAGSLSAAYFAPTLDMRAPQLGANEEGIFLSRVGVVPWSKVRGMWVEHRALRTMRLATLYIETDGPVREAVSSPDRVGFFTRFTARNTTVRGNKAIAHLHTLSLAPTDVEHRLKALRASAS